LLHHSLLTIPSLAAPYYNGKAPDGILARILVTSPLHLAWAGTEAVIMFFVLSGIVLAKAATAKSFSLAAYFPSRLVRLYAPVVAAVAFGALTILISPRTAFVASDWLASRPHGYTPVTFLQDTLLLSGVSRTISPLWSLQWEVLFSLLLPVYVFASRNLRLRTQFIGAIALTALGYVVGLPVLMYLPMFAVGTALGTHWSHVEALATAISNRRWGNLSWFVAAIVGCTLTIGYWLALPFVSGAAISAAAGPVTLVGVTLIIVCAAFWRPAKWLLSTTVFAWLGRISFSLYLIHEPIVIAIAFLAPGVKWTLAVSIPLAILIAWLFYRLIERPTHRLARSVRGSAALDETIHSGRKAIQ
jgi:peptidoglycan/LPS O-acetylase OafA/YrhL